MAFIRCESGGGGGIITEKTILWSNSAPASNFTAQDVVLSQPFDNFALIGITYKVLSTSVDTYDVVMFATDFKKSRLITGAGTQNVPRLTLSEYTGSASTGSTRIRMAFCVKDDDTWTKIHFASCGKYAKDSGTSGETTDNRCIPVQIFGVG